MIVQSKFVKAIHYFFKHKNKNENLRAEFLHRYQNAYYLTLDAIFGLKIDIRNNFFELIQ